MTREDLMMTGGYKAPRSTTRWKSIVTVLAATTLLAMCANGVGKSRSAPTSESGESTVAAEQVVDVTASGLLAEYEANELAADARYRGRLVRVTGVVDRIGEDIAGEAYVTLKANDPIRRVQCYFGEEQRTGLARLKKGDEVVIRGRGDGLLGNVFVRASVFE